MEALQDHSNGIDSMSKQLQCAIIGCGVVSPVHAKAYHDMPECELRWACDLIPDRAQKLADDYAIPNTCTDYRKVLDDPQVDCLSVCTDHGSHAEIVSAALAAGKHVLCEKALAPCKEDLDTMEQAHAQAANTVFAGVFQNRFHPTYIRTKELIESGAFGKILTANVSHLFYRADDYYITDAWRGTWEHDGGAVMINQSIHFVDIIQWLMGGICSVSAKWSNLTKKDVIETEDTMVAAVQFCNGALGTFNATSSSNRDWDPMISIYGTEGMIEIRHGKIIRMEFKNADVQAKAEKLYAQKEKTSATVGKSYYSPYHGKVIIDFVQAVGKGREPFVPASQARKTVDIVLAMYKSALDESWTEVHGVSIAQKPEQTKTKITKNAA